MTPVVVTKPKAEVIETKPTVVEPSIKAVEQPKKPVPLEEKPKTKELIPKFYFPQGQNQNLSDNESLLNKQLKQVKEEVFTPKQEKLRLEDFGKVAQVNTSNCTEKIDNIPSFSYSV